MILRWGFTCKSHPDAKGVTGKAKDRLTEVELFVSSDRCLDLSYLKYWNKADFSTLSVVELNEKMLPILL